MQRKSDNHKLFDAEIENFPASRAKKRKSITSIEDLSNDLFYDIFDYLEGFELYKAFSNLNARFQDLFKHTSLRLKFYFPLETTFQFQNRLKDVIVPNRHLILSLYTHGIRNNDVIFTSMIIDSSFNRLESLNICKIKSDILPSILRNLSTLPRLFSLKIIVFDKTVNYYDPYLMIFGLPVLKYSKLSIENIGSSEELWADNNYSSSSLQYLIIEHSCTLSKLVAMLSSASQLRHLYCQFLNRSNQSIGNNVEITLHNLTHLSFCECKIRFSELEILLKKIGSRLQVVRLTTVEDKAYFNGDRWRQLLAHYIPHLRLFELEHQQAVNVASRYFADYAFIRYFTSTFWKKPSWIIKFKFFLDFLDDLCIIFSINSHKEEWYQLNEGNKHSSNADQPSQSVVLKSIDRCFAVCHRLHIEQLVPIFVALYINHLIIESRDIPVTILIQIISLSPNLNSLKIRSLSLLNPIYLVNQDAINIDLISKKNNISKMNLEQINEFEEVQFLINLCPHLQYFQVGCSDKVDLKLLVRSILMKTTQTITELRTLCLNVNQPNDEMIKELQDVIHHGQWFQNYTIMCIDEKIYIQSK